MLNPRLLRENPDLIRDALRRRHSSASLDDVLDLDARRRAILTEQESLSAHQNKVSTEIGRDKEKLPELREQLRRMGERIKELRRELADVEADLEQRLLLLPNIPDPSVPEGESDADNPTVATWGEPRRFDFVPRPHWEVGERLGLLDFERGTKVSGPRSWSLWGPLARLNRALIQWMLDVHVEEHGYTEVATPYLVRPECMVGTGQLPKFAEESYRVESDDLYLIPTAEVPVTNLHREEILEPGTLPRNYVAYSACFRREAGAAGRDTRGLLRVHHFEKVEMVKIVAPDESDRELETLLDNALDILRRLEIPYRVKLLCTGDLTFSSAKTYDPEAWLPGQDRWVEISSCSNFADFQARRAGIRYRSAPGGKPEFAHTLNGSGLAVGRTLAAVLENYQLADGSVVVPNVLRPYLRGLDVVRPVEGKVASASATS